MDNANLSFYHIWSVTDSFKAKYDSFSILIKVVIRTNTAKTELVVNAPKDTVKHFDKVGTVHVIAVDKENCYEENGEAVFTQVDSGKYKTSASAEVELLYVSDAANVKVAVTEGTVDHAHAYDKTEAGNLNATNQGLNLTMTVIRNKIVQPMFSTM